MKKNRMKGGVFASPGPATLLDAHTYVPASADPSNYFTDEAIVNAIDLCEASHWNPSNYIPTGSLGFGLTNTDTSSDILGLSKCILANLYTGNPDAFPNENLFKTPVVDTSGLTFPGPCTTAQGVRGECQPSWLGTDPTSIGITLAPDVRTYGGSRKNPRSTKNKKKVTSRMAKRSRTHRRKASRKSRRSTRRSRR